MKVDAKTTDSAIGKPIDRVDGHLKVTGAARYSAEWPMTNLAYGIVIESTIARGKIVAIDSSRAESLAGVIAVFSHINKPFVVSKKAQKKAERLFLLQDNTIHYAGQMIALVLADSFETARYAASLVQISYDAETFKTVFDQSHDRLKSVAGYEDSLRGDPDNSLASAPVKLDATYTTPRESHNPMEPFATTAVWEGDELTLYDSTQGVHTTRKTVADVLDMPPEKVRVISHFIGGGFGCKLTVWSHVPLAAVAARKLGRPVRVVLDRHQMFAPVGFRPATTQKVALGADRSGKLLAISHEGVCETSTFKDFVEAVADATKSTYACANVKTSHRVVRMDIGEPTWMRAPGHATGSFALESAMDELAYKLNMDPLELRLTNWADKDYSSGLPWSSNALRDCYKQAAEKFGWSKRHPKPRSMKDGLMLVGYGMATAIHSVWRNPASARVVLNSDGTAVVQSGSQDIGTGTYTVMTQVAAQTLSLPLNKVTFELGDTRYPEAPLSGGSTTAGSVGNAVAQACSAALSQLLTLAIADLKSPLHGVPVTELTADNGYVRLKNKPEVGETFAAIVTRAPGKTVEVRIDAKPGNEEEKFSMSTFGAQFAEVHVDPDLGTVRVQRFVGAYDAGRILNPKTARSQILGGIAFGMGMALTEQTWTDNNLGRVVNADFAEYHVPVHADIGAMDVIFVESEDSQVNVIGAKGIGELGITGAAAAIANAVFHATGTRIRDLPITLDKLLFT